MNEPIRILNLFTIMNRGGAETMVMNYYRAIDKSKIQFDFMVHRQEKGAYDDEIEAMGGRIFRMCPIYPQNLFRYKRMLKEFFDNHPEYQILHSHMSELGYFAFKEAIRHHVPVRICHAHSSPNFKIETFKEKLKVLPREILARGMRKFSTDFFVCSKIAGDWLFGKKNESKFIMMNNAVNAASFAYNKETADIIKTEMKWGDKIVVGHVGRFIVPKNHSFLIDIFQQFHAKHPQSILVLVGDGDQRENICNKIKKLNLEDCIILLGFRSDTANLYKAFDIFVFPSLYEGLPVSLVEAQSAGLSCIVSDTISTQARILPNYSILSLKVSLGVWVNEMEKHLNDKRENTTENIKKAKFDIYSNAEWLTNLYLNKLS
jgi:glycosyltransferase involved in cell wall biosynthesis